MDSRSRNSFLSATLMVSESHLRLFSCSPRAYRWSNRSLADLDMPPIESNANPTVMKEVRVPLVLLMCAMVGKSGGIYVSVGSLDGEWVM